MSKTKISLSPIERFDEFNENLLRYLKNGKPDEDLERIRRGIASTRSDLESIPDEKEGRLRVIRYIHNVNNAIREAHEAYNRETRN